MITCRDQLMTSINSHLKQILNTNLVTPSIQQKEMVEQAANIIASDNMELACAIVQKTAVEKAIPEIDKKLCSEYELRRIARKDGRCYCDALALTYQAERMPEPIRLKVGGLTPSQMAVYEEFGRNIPGFLPNERDATILMQNPLMNQLEPQPHPSTPFPINQAVLANDEVTLVFEKYIAEIEQFVQLTSSQAQYSLMNTNMLRVRDCILHFLRTRDVAMPPPQALVQKCVESLQDCLVPTLSETDPVVLRFKDLNLKILKTLLGK